MTPEPYDAPKKRSGFRVFMYVFVSLLGLLTLTCGAGIYYLTQTEKGQQIFEAFRETTNLAEEAMKAPGAEELRALGCDTAMVITVSDFTKMIEILAPEETIPQDQADTKIVMCQMNLLGGDGPDCASVARTYVDATAPPDAFLVHVSKQGGVTSCEGSYAADGSPLE